MEFGFILPMLSPDLPGKQPALAAVEGWWGWGGWSEARRSVGQVLLQLPWGQRVATQARPRSRADGERGMEEDPGV